MDAARDLLAQTEINRWLQEPEAGDDAIQVPGGTPEPAVDDEGEDGGW